jgi:CheY-like chemotaxis protein
MSLPNQQIIILLVEDSHDDIFFFHRAVQKALLPALTFVAADGIEAIDYLSNKGRFADAAAYPRPDIMFLDLKLPHCNGFEVLEWMRRHPEFLRTPVVILTSSGQAEDQARAEALGIELYLIKPPAPEQLRQALRKYALARLEALEAMRS